MPAQFLHEMITLVDQQKGDEALYQFVLALPPLYRDTVLFTLRLAWQYFLFRGPWTYNHSEEQFASHCVIMALPKRLVFDEHINVDSLTKCVVGLLHAVALHKREEFLPEDPTVLEIEKYKVLLFSGIRPVLSAEIAYEYTIENLHRLEQTAETMFTFGILPRVNTYGCSRHKLPVTDDRPVRIFRKTNAVMMKTAMTRAYVKGLMTLSPFVDSVICDARRVALEQIDVRVPAMPDV